MPSYTQILYHLVINTKKKKNTMLEEENHERLYRYMNGILQEYRCHAYCINGVENHIHLLFSLHPSVSLASLVRSLKVSSNKFIKKERLFKKFDCWAIKYGAFTRSIDSLDSQIFYIENQKEHHKKYSFEVEFRKLLHQNRIDFDEDYFLKD